MQEKHIVLYSGGAGSAFIGNWVAKKYGKENTILLFTDTLWEDEDNYRFMEDCANYIGIEITYVINGDTPEDVFFKQSYLGNSRYAPCSINLKMKETIKYVDAMLEEGKFKPILYFGIDFEEKQRAIPLKDHYLDNCIEPVETRFPLITGDIWKDDGTKNNETMRDTKQIIQNDWKIELPRMYKLGFSHANCAGRCVRGGKGHYALLLKVWPQNYKAQEEMEERFRREINPNVTIFKDETLKDFRTKLENDKNKWDKFIALNKTDEDAQGVPCVCSI